MIIRYEDEPIDIEIHFKDGGIKIVHKVVKLQVGRDRGKTVHVQYLARDGKAHNHYYKKADIDFLDKLKPDTVAVRKPRTKSN